MTDISTMIRALEACLLQSYEQSPGNYKVGHNCAVCPYLSDHFVGESCQDNLRKDLLQYLKFQKNDPPVARFHRVDIERMMNE